MQIIEEILNRLGQLLFPELSPSPLFWVIVFVMFGLSGFILFHFAFKYW